MMIVRIGLVSVLLATAGVAGAGPGPVPDSVWKTHVYHLNRALNYRALLDAWARRCPTLAKPVAADLFFIDMLVKDRMLVGLNQLDAEEILRQRVFQEQGEERAAEEYAEFGSCESRRIPGHLARIAERMGTELKTFAALPQLSRYEVRYGLGIDPPG